MTNEYEKLSALMDDGLDEHEARPVLDRIRRDTELQSVWRRYHVAGAALRHELGAGDVAARVAARLAGEPAILVPNPMRRARGAWQAAAGLAIAASVALVAIVGIRTEPVEQSTPAPVAAVSQDDFIRASETRWSTREPGLESRLNMYLVEHNEFAPTSGIKGMIGFVHVVGYDNEK